MATNTQATIKDLYEVAGKAEIVNGEIVRMPPTGALPGRAGGAIYRSLSEHERKSGSGFAFPDNVGFHVGLPNRQSFSPDAAWHTGKLTGMRFLEGAPVFAVEVRSEDDYGPRAERILAEKRRDYFAAGAFCVWDVDLLGAAVIRAYHANNPDKPIIFRRGDRADAGAAVPGWSMPVDDLFPAKD
jgi:Uma2 family endonuclease